MSRSPFPFAAACAVALFAGAPAARAAFAPGGPVHILDDAPLACGNYDPALAATGTGFVAAWSDFSDLAVRRLDARGRPVGARQSVAIGSISHQELVSLPGGGFAVAWFHRDSGRVMARLAGAGGVFGPAVQVGTADDSFTSGIGGIDLAVGVTGNLVVVWTDGGDAYLREVRPDGTLVGAAPFLVERQVPVSASTVPHLLDPVALALPDGTLRMFWISAGLFRSHYLDRGFLQGRRLTPTTGGSYSAGDLIQPGGYGLDVEGAVGADGGYVLAWATFQEDAVLPVGPPLHFLESALFAADDHVRGVFASPGEEVGFVRMAGVAVEPLAAGGFAVAFEGEPEGDPNGYSHAYLFEVDTDGGVIQDLTPAAPPGSPGQALPELALGFDGSLLVVWQELGNFITHSPPCEIQTIRARSFALGCGAPGAFCVDQGRFQLSLTYADPRRGLAGTGSGVPLTADSGYFWFFAPDNVEVVVKVLDGRPVNGHYWVFYGGLTDVGFTLTVRDTLTSAVRTFVHAPGTLASRGVTDAFPAPALSAPGATVAPLRVTGLVRDAFAGDTRATTLGGVGAPTAGAREATGIPPCSPPELPVVPGPGLCLEGRRFNVTATWAANGATGVGQGVPLGDDSGYFWFFSPDNVELVVKVLDGRPVNGHFWVFYGALSNVEYDLEVSHVLGNLGDSDGSATYHNPAGTFGSRADTTALRPPGSDVCPSVPAPVCGQDGLVYSNQCAAAYRGWVQVNPSRQPPCW
jgi:hypothetical protein